MITWAKKTIYTALITALSTFKPALLFHKVNQLSWYQTMLQQWADSHKLNVNNRTLEVACATGELGDYLSKSGHIVTGIDASQPMIKMAQLKDNSVNYQVADAYSLPFDNGSFDTVLSASLVNIVSDPQKVIDEMIRVCRQGGNISILVPKQGFSHDGVEELAASLGVTKFSNAVLHFWNEYAPKMTVLDIEQLFRNAGLSKTHSTNYLQGMIISVSGIKNSGSHP